MDDNKLDGMAMLKAIPAGKTLEHRVDFNNPNLARDFIGSCLKPMQASGLLGPSLTFTLDGGAVLVHGESLQLDHFITVLAVAFDGAEGGFQVKGQLPS